MFPFSDLNPSFPLLGGKNSSTFITPTFYLKPIQFPVFIPPLFNAYIFGTFCGGIDLSGCTLPTSLFISRAGTLKSDWDKLKNSIQNLDDAFIIEKVNEINRYKNGVSEYVCKMAKNIHGDTDFIINCLCVESEIVKSIYE